MSEPRQIPGTETLEFKNAFIERYSALTDWEKFKRYSLSFLRRSIRINTIFGTVDETTSSIKSKGWNLTPIPWCKEGFWIEHPERRDVGNLFEYHVGKIYVQEAASLIPPLVLNPQPGDIVLDLCASPGSKTTQLGMMMQNKGIIIANDYKGQRLQSLGINVQRSGLTNTVVTLMSGTRFSGLFSGLLFDKILVDAPCSGTGTIRKSLKTVTIWNASMITKLARQQKELIVAAFENLKEGGVLVYSTCSLEPEENEGVVEHLLQVFPSARLMPARVRGLKTSLPVMEFNGQKFSPQMKHVLRIWPQDNDTEGFFVAKIKKEKNLKLLS